MQPDIADPPPGTWRVIDADGNVVESGDTIHLEMATSIGEQEEDTDGSDR